jgi:IS5 family transposase
LRFERSSPTHWRQRVGKVQLVALIQESLSVAHKTEALATRDLKRVVVDITVPPKAIAHLTDAWLCHRVLEKPVDLARRNDVGYGGVAVALPSALRLWSGATLTRTSSSGRGASSNSCAFSSAVVIRDVRRKIGLRGHTPLRKGGIWVNTKP